MLENPSSAGLFWMLLLQMMSLAHLKTGEKNDRLEDGHAICLHRITGAEFQIRNPNLSHYVQGGGSC